ncbi:carbonate dehydratase [Comamonas serinivorans]|uniref:Carbonic anhydrase n=1 Tax=Comamonas serinivorans TaxID=1082851 RepID=A0A1Y0ESD0_9BURK|nr:carbonate dehydratase [Comamonas serinivorans]ARU06418.1 carbonate dehydratase [Comamonas serinivorans]
MDHSQQPDYPELFEKNREWARRVEEKKPGFFRNLQAQQQPKYMWVGCSDSRVPANQVIGLAPGEVFVHRNVANVVVPTDLNSLSTIQFAVDVLKVEHLMIVGHYGCGGVKAALHDMRVGLADNWLRHVKDVRDRHRALLDGVPEQDREDVLCELNAIEQCVNVAHTTVMQDCWARGQKVTLHAWCYGLKDGLVHDLHMDLSNNEGLATTYKAAVDAVRTLDRS